jgi:arginine/lysine/histidine/glutamine transport system substrate-binding/permease protein
VSQFIGIILDALPFLLQGALITLQLAAVSVFFGLIGGSLLGILRLSPSPIVRIAARAYIDFFRGTPLLVQLFMVYFGIPGLCRNLGFQFTFNQFSAAVLTLSLNSAAYLGETVRAGIQSIEVGQREASESLGLGPVQTMRYVIFPQAFRRMIPPIGNEFISLLKDTSLASVIGFAELLQQGRFIVARNFRSFEIYAAVALVYLALTLLSSKGIDWLEWRMDPVARLKNKAVRAERLARQ